MMANEGENEDAAHHHDQLNEFGEETWSAFGERRSIVTQNQEQIEVDDGNLSEHIVLHVGTVSSLSETVESSQEFENADDLPLGKEDVIESHFSLLPEQYTFSSLEYSSKESLDEDFISKDATPSSSIKKKTANAHSLLASKSSASRLAEFCRICHESKASDKFISPCDCRGTLYLVHKSCLERWIAQSDAATCELCGYHFRIERIPKYGRVEALGAWLKCSTSWRDRRQLLMDLLLLIFLCPVIFLMNHLAFGDHGLLEQSISRSLKVTQNEIDNESDEPVDSKLPKLCETCAIAIVLLFDFGLAASVILRLQYHLYKWQDWYKRNCRITLVGYSEINVSVNEEPSTGSSENIRVIAF